MYQVWTKAEYEEAWHLTECDGLSEVENIIRANFGKEVQVLLSMPVEFDAKIAVKIHAPTGPAGEPTAMKAVENRLKEVKQSEATKVKAGPGEGAGAKGKSEI